MNNEGTAPQPDCIQPPLTMVGSCYFTALYQVLSYMASKEF
jgi:hypothetical protein